MADQSAGSSEALAPFDMDESTRLLIQDEPEERSFSYEDLPPLPVSWKMHFAARLKEIVGLSVAVTAAIVVLLVPFMEDNPGARRCLALTLFVAVLWSTTALPPFVTAFCIPFFVVALSILPFPATTAATTISMAFFDPVILLFLGGLTFAAALDKYQLNQRLALLVLRVAGPKPIWNLAALMGLSYFLSMWVTNVAASVVAVSIAKPIIDKLPRSDPYSKGMLIGIATACNTGGMSTPIASPQNAIAVLWVTKASNGLNNISFVRWMGYAVPVSLTLSIIAWLFLYWLFRPHCKRVPLDQDTKLPPMTYVHYYILVIVILTIAGWCTFSFTENASGNLGIISLFPIVAFYSVGILTKSDYERMSWSVLTLIGGGVAIGVAATQSQLLDILSDGLASLVGGSGAWVVSAAFVGLMAVISNFLPHSVVGIIVLPVVAKTGVSIGREILVVMMAGIMNSGASCLPVSSFPNANSFAQKRSGETEEVLTTMDYIKSGVPNLVACAAVLLSMGYGLFGAF